MLPLNNFYQPYLVFSNLQHKRHILTELPTLNFTVVPGCCVAEKPEPPKRDVVPPNGFEVVLVDPKSPPLLVLVPKPNNQEKHFMDYNFF